MTKDKRLSAEELSAIKERANKATAGPWIVNEYKDNRFCVRLPNYGRVIADGLGISDSLFIAQASEDIPKLLTEVEILRAELNHVKEISFFFRHTAEKNAKKFKQYEESLREIDCHIRSTPEAIPHIIETLKQNLPEYNSEMMRND